MERLCSATRLVEQKSFCIMEQAPKLDFRACIVTSLKHMQCTLQDTIKMVCRTFGSLMARKCLWWRKTKIIGTSLISLNDHHKACSNVGIRFFFPDIVHHLTNFKVIRVGTVLVLDFNS